MEQRPPKSQWLGWPKVEYLQIGGIAVRLYFLNRKARYGLPGMVMGKNRQNEFVIVTPLQAIIRDLKETTGVQYS